MKGARMAPRFWQMGLRAPCFAALALSLSACQALTPDATARVEAGRQIDSVDRMRAELDAEAPAGIVARSQIPAEPIPNATGRPPVRPAVGSMADPNAIKVVSAEAQPADALTINVPKSSLDTAVRIVATVGGRPIYDQEVREATYQRLYEIMQLPEGERKTKESLIYQEELKNMIERELILDEMFARLKKTNKANALKDLEEAAERTSTRQLEDFKNSRNLPSDDVLKMILKRQGLSIEGMRRQVARNFMMQTYMRSVIQPQVDGVNMRDVRDYYDARQEEFQTEDKVVWNDLFVSTRAFPDRAQAKEAALAIARKAKAGEDFDKLIEKYDQGLNLGKGKGVGYGEKPGEIRPSEFEPILLGMSEGGVELVEMEAGFHVLRIAKRTVKGTRPFDEKTQEEARRRLAMRIYEGELRRVVDTLWRRNPPQINLD